MRFFRKKERALHPLAALGAMAQVPVWPKGQINFGRYVRLPTLFRSYEALYDALVSVKFEGNQVDVRIIFQEVKVAKSVLLKLRKAKPLSIEVEVFGESEWFGKKEGEKVPYDLALQVLRTVVPKPLNKVPFFRCIKAARYLGEAECVLMKHKESIESKEAKEA